jgi:Helix-turn-helix domain
MTQILNSAQVAEMLGCSVRTVEDHARAGTLKGTKFGDGWIFLSDMLVEDVRAKCDAESSTRVNAKRQPASIQLRDSSTAMLKRPPGMGHLSEEAVRKILRTQ